MQAKTHTPFFNEIHYTTLIMEPASTDSDCERRDTRYSVGLGTKLPNAKCIYPAAELRSAPEALYSLNIS